MKNFMQNRGHLVAVLGIVLVSASLVACGGGGGGGSSVVTPPTPVPVACPAGGTAATADLCAVLTGSISVADGVSPDTLFANGFSTTTTGSTQVPNVDNVKLYAGAGEVGATVPLTFSDFTPTSFKVKLTTKPLYSQPYTFVANLIDGLGRPFKIVKTFTTGADANSCTAPTTWSAGLGACVYPMGVKVVTANQLPAGCNTAASQCWKDAAVNGTVKWVATSAVMTGLSNTANNNRPMVFAYFRNTSTQFGVTGLWNYLVMYASDGSLFGPDIFGGSTDETDWVYGNAQGIIYHLKASNLCYQFAWDASQKSWNVNGNGNGQPTTCPQ